MTSKLNNAWNSTVIKRKTIIHYFKNTHAVSTQAVSLSHPESNLTSQSTTHSYTLPTVCEVGLLATYGREMETCGVFIPSHSDQAIAIPVPIPIKLA